MKRFSRCAPWDVFACRANQGIPKTRGACLVRIAALAASRPGHPRSAEAPKTDAFLKHFRRFPPA